MQVYVPLSHSVDLVKAKSWSPSEVGQALLEKHEAYVRRHGIDDEGSDTQVRATGALHSCECWR